MDATKIVRFLQLLNCQNITVRESWVSASCPLAPYLHSKCKDARPSFGVSVDPLGRSVCKCFSCTQTTKPLGHVLFVIWRRTGRWNIKAAELLADCEHHDNDPLPTERWEFEDVWAEFDKSDIPVFPAKALDIFPLLEGRDTKRARDSVDYLVSRGIPECLIYKYGVRYSKRRSGHIVFPFTDCAGNIQILRVRQFPEKACFTVNENVSGLKDKFPTLSQVGAWFGLEFVDWYRTVTIVEGSIDHLRLVALGHANVIAAGGKSVTKAQFKALAGWSYLIGFDSDKYGKEAAQVLRDRFDQTGAYSEILDWSLVGCKDPGELRNRAQLRKVIRKRLRIFQ